MHIQLSRRLTVISYGASFLLFLAGALRGIVAFWGTGERWYVIGAMLLYLVLVILVLLVPPDNLRTLYGIIILQTAIGLALLLSLEPNDYFALLFIPPSAECITTLSPKTALRWIGAIIVVMIFGLLIRFPLSFSVSYIITYIAAIAGICSLIYFARQAEEARRQSEELLSELTRANQRLQAYSLQVQELAAAEERNRLARELHDSVTQTIFSLTLAAQSARLLLERDPGRVAGQLDRLQELAQNALAEMRALVRHLRPRPVSSEGLLPALRRHFAERQVENQLSVDLQVDVERRLPAEMEETLFRVIQEALNNVVKHAGTDRATVRFCLSSSPGSVLIEDRGCGFDLASFAPVPGHLGVASMQERVQSMGGRFEIDSRPGAGTCVRVENLVFPEG